MVDKHKNFEESFRYGEAVERYVLSILKDKYPESNMPGGYNKNWDIYIPEKGWGVEVKCDMTSNKSDQFVVEVAMADKPSALMTTKASLWVYYDGFSLYWVKPNRLKDAIILDGYPQQQIKSGADRSYKRVYFIPKKMMRKYALYVTEPLTNVPKEIQFKYEK
jgi:hypothetical protein